MYVWVILVGQICLLGVWDVCGCNIVLFNCCPENGSREEQVKRWERDREEQSEEMGHVRVNSPPKHYNILSSLVAYFNFVWSDLILHWADRDHCGRFVSPCSIALASPVLPSSGYRHRCPVLGQVTYPGWEDARQLLKFVRWIKLQFFNLSHSFSQYIQPQNKLTLFQS
jgi:hypothetical protein